MLVSRYPTVEPVPATVRPKGVALEPCREGAMTERPARARSRRVSALLSAVAVPVAGCTTAGGGSSLRVGRAGPAQHSVAARPHGRVVGYGSPGLPRPSALRTTVSRRLPRPRPWRVRLHGAPRRSTGPTPRPACGWRCRRACAAAGVLVPGPAVAAALAGGRGCGRVHTWPGRAVHAGSGQLVGIVRRSGRCVGLAADHMPAQSGQPGPLRVRTRLAPRAAQRLARADPHRQRALMPM